MFGLERGSAPFSRDQLRPEGLHHQMSDASEGGADMAASSPSSGKPGYRQMAFARGGAGGGAGGASRPRCSAPRGRWAGRFGLGEVEGHGVYVAVVVVAAVCGGEEEKKKRREE